MKDSQVPVKDDAKARVTHLDLNHVEKNINAATVSLLEYTASISRLFLRERELT